MIYHDSLDGPWMSEPINYLYMIDHVLRHRCINDHPLNFDIFIRGWIFSVELLTGIRNERAPHLGTALAINAPNFLPAIFRPF